MARLKSTALSLYRVCKETASFQVLPKKLLTEQQSNEINSSMRVKTALLILHKNSPTTGFWGNIRCKFKFLEQ